MSEHRTRRVEISNAMRDVGVRLDPTIMNKCLTLCTSLHIDAARLAESWEVYSLNKNVTALDDHSFAPFKQSLLKDLETETHQSEMESYDPQSAILTSSKRIREDDSSERHTSTPMTPNHKKIKDNDAAAQRRVSLSPNSSQTLPQSDSLQQLQTQLLYEQRSGAGTTVFTYNPHNLNATPTPIHTTISHYGTQNLQASHFRYMFHSLDERAQALDDHLQHLQQAYFDTEDISNYEAMGVPKQDSVSVIGRICNDAHTGRLHPTSVLLEGPRHQNGTRVSLRLDAVSDSYSLFPGQIVKVEGMNASGRSMVAKSMTEGSPLPFPKTKVKELMQFQHLGDAQGRPLGILTACGPFTTNANLEYEPLFDFIMGTVKAETPNVVILMGPFVDLRQPLLQSPSVKVSVEEEDGSRTMSVSHETLFVAKITNLLEQLYEEAPDCKTQFVLVPSVDDAISEPVFPQPPMTDRIPNGKEPKLPHAEGMELGTLFLDPLNTNPSSPKIHCVSNPCTLQINELVIGVTSTDTLLHISSEEINSKLMGNRMSRIAQHLIQQQSYYPLFPPPMTGNANLDLTKLDHLKLPCTPDILLVPSKLAPFCKNVLGCMVMNPGFLSKGMTGGTFASMNVHPMERATLEELDGDVEMEHTVSERIRVDIKKI